MRAASAAALLLALLLPTAAGAAQHALLVGIGDYIYYGPQSDPGQRLPKGDLPGCVQDAAIAKDVMVALGFPESNIEVLLNHDATRDNILSGLDRLAARTKPGDVVYFHFSGHGFQLQANKPNSEKDYKDELIACADYAGDPFTGNNKYGTAGCIRDDEIAAKIAKINTSKKLFVFDCCHSGTISRALSAQPRRLPTIHTDKVLPEMGDSEGSAFGADIEAQVERSGGSGRGYIVFSACRDDQTAMDTGKFGIMTYTFFSSLLSDESRMGDDMRVLLNRTYRMLAELGYTQVPQLTLGGEYAKQPQLATVKKMFFPDDEPQNTSQTQAEPQAQPQQQAQQQPPSPPFATAPGSEEKKVMVKIAGFDNRTTSRIAGALNATSYAMAVESAEQRAIVRDASTGKTSLLTADGVEVTDLTGLAPDALIKKADPFLVQAYLLKSFALLENGDSQFNVELELVTVKGSRGGTPDRPLLDVGNLMEVHVSVDRPAYLTLADITSTGDLVFLLPNDTFAINQQTRPGETYRFPPPGHNLELTVAPPAGTMMLIAIATSEPLDLSAFKPRKIEGLAGARSIGKEESIEMGSQARNLVLQVAEQEDGGWGTAIVVADIKE